MSHSFSKAMRGWRVSALAAVALSMTISAQAFSAPSHIKVLGRTSQPIGHYEYCKKYSGDCRIRSRSTHPTELTRPRWTDLVEINAHANRTVTPITDLQFYNVEELWTYPKNYGDCEDYVLLKRHLLMERGWPASSLLITVVTQPNGDGHAVLTVRTDRAEYVLDNLSNKILPWAETPYRFLKRQSASHSGQWVALDDVRNVVVGSVD